MAIKKTIMINDGSVKIKKVFVFIKKSTPAYNIIYYYKAGVNKKELPYNKPFSLAEVV